jgi:hypothetical protein
LKQERRDILSFKARRISKEMRTSVLQISFMITSCVFLVALYEAGFSTPSAASESIPAEIRATKNETEYAPSWAFQWRSLQREEQIFWNVLACLFPGLFSILFILVKYFCRRLVSYRDIKTKQELSHPMIILQKGESSAREMGGALAFMQELEERRGQFQNKLEPIKKIVNVEKERHDRFQNEMDLMKKMIKVDEERQDQFQNVMLGMKTMMKEEEKRRVQFLKQMDAMRTLMKAAQRHPAVLQYKALRLKMMMKEDDKRRVPLLKGVDPVKRNGATQFS